MAIIKLDVWQEPDGKLSRLCFSGEFGEESRSLLEPNSIIIYSFFADSHFDAMTKYYEFLGYGVYQTDFASDKQPFDLKKIKVRAKMRIEIDRIFWEEWDPLDIHDMAPRNEYAGYVPQVLNLVVNGITIEEIAERLFHIENKIMGTPGNMAVCMKIAKKMEQYHVSLTREEAK